MTLIILCMTIHTSIENEIKDFLEYFFNNDKSLMTIRLLYLYGIECSGKTTFIKDTLKKLNYEMIYYNSIDLKSCNIFQMFSRNNMSSTCILSCLRGDQKKNVIVIDDLYNIDKSNISQLVKLLRPKRTKRQKKEPYFSIPIICINNIVTDKKINELKKIAKNVFFPSIIGEEDDIYFENSKEIVKYILEQKIDIRQHNQLIQETERTSVSLILHENIVDHIKDHKDYLALIDVICEADFMERVMFQKQVWILNELISLLKNIKNNHIFHKFAGKISNPDIRFTKILTKYSNEYNNEVFIHNICNVLRRDWKDVISLFSCVNKEDIQEECKDLGISNLEQDRMFRFINTIS